MRQPRQPFNILPLVAFALSVLALWLLPSRGADVPKDRLIVWDGDDHAGGKGWVGPDAKVDRVEVTDADAHDGKHALRLHGEGAGWIGGGWNWHGWFPEDAGTDISGYKNLVFWVKATGAAPDSVTVSLDCSSNKKPTGSLGVTDYAPAALDGKWHEVVIPLKDLYEKRDEKADGSFDPKTAWGLLVNTWSADEQLVRPLHRRHRLRRPGRQGRRRRNGRGGRGRRAGEAGGGQALGQRRDGDGRGGQLGRGDADQPVHLRRSPWATARRPPSAG